MIAALHTLHVLVIVLGTLAVAGVLRNAGRDDRAVDALRRAGPGGVIALAERRAQLALTRPAIPRAVVFASATTTFAGAVHAAVGPEHFREGVRFGLFFLVLSITQFALAYAVARRPSAQLLLGLAAVNLGTAALWLVTRLVALPFGLDTVEPVGVWDATASAAEVVAFVIALRSASLLAGRVRCSVVRTQVGVG